MAEIFTGLNVGIGDRDVRLGGIGSSRCGRMGGSLSVNAMNGNMVLSRDEGVFSEGLNTIHFGDTYNSLNQSFKFGFISSLTQQGVANALGSSLLLTQSDGHLVRYYFNEARECYISMEDSRSVIRYANEQYSLKDGDTSGAWVYSEEGLLIQRQDKSGHCLYFSYENGHLSSIHDEKGLESVIFQFENQTLTSLQYCANGEERGQWGLTKIFHL